MSTAVRDLEGFLGEISDAVGSTRYYDDIELSVEGIERIIMAADPSEQGKPSLAFDAPKPFKLVAANFCSFS
jgi:hypothetical protein